MPTKTNKVSFQSEQALAQPMQLKVFPATNNPELIELLVTGEQGTSQENFFQKLQTILNKTPKIGTTAKTEFFPYGVIGSVVVLPNTPLMNKLHIKHLYLNPISSRGFLTIKVALQLEKSGKKSLQFYTFTTVQKISKSQHWQTAELEEIIAQLGITQAELENYKMDGTLQIKGKIYHIDSKCSLNEIDLKLGEGNKPEHYKSLQDEFPRLTKELPLSLEEGRFKEISQLTEKKLDPASTSDALLIQLEPYFQKLSTHVDMTGITDAMKRLELQARITQQFSEAGSDIFRTLAKLYQYWQPILGLGTSEAAYHGFSAGILEQFKYRYALDISVEKILGLGRADLLFLSRLDGLSNKNWEAIPLVTEFKAGQESPQQGLDQINRQGYLHHTPRMRTVSTQGVALGVNFNPVFSGSVASAVTKIKVEPTNFIKQCVDVADEVLASDVTLEFTNKLQASLTDLHYSIVTSNGANDNSHYLDRLLWGQAMGSSALNLPTKAFIFETNSVHSTADTSFFFIREKNVYVVNLLGSEEIFQEHDLHRLPSLDLIQKHLPNDGLTEESSYVRIDILLQKNKSNPIKLELKKGLLKANPDNHYLRSRYHTHGEFKEIKPFSFIDEQNGDLAVTKLSQELVNKQELINSESDLQAIVQGGLLASGELQVFTESNHLLGGRADLVAVPIDRSNQNKRFKLIELKYAETSKIAKEQQEKAKEQVKKYKTNLKSFSDNREVDLIALTYDGQPEQGGALLLYEKVAEKIVHTSGSSSSERVVSGSESDVAKPLPQEAAEMEVSSNEQEAINPIEEAPVFEQPASEDGFKTPLKSPDPGYSGDTDSPEKSSNASILGKVLGGIAAGLVALAGAASATGGTITGSVSAAAGGVTTGLTSAINQLRSELSSLHNLRNSDTQELVRDVNQFLDDVAKAKQHNKFAERIAKQKENVEKLAKSYKEKGKKVENKINKRKREAEAIKDKNKRKKTLCEAGPSRAKRDTLCPIENGNAALNINAAANPSFPAEINRFFSLCNMNAQGVLDCYLKIDYQDRNSTLVDVSLWDLHNKTLTYAPCHDELVLSLSNAEQVFLANARSAQYELIDVNATSFKSILQETRKHCPDETTDIMIEEVEQVTPTASVNSLNMTTQYEYVAIANCSIVELTTAYNQPYVEGDCLINPIANTMRVIEINPFVYPVFIKFASWKLLQQDIEYTESNNTLAIRVNTSNERLPFRVELTDYLNELNTTSYQLSDRFLKEIALVFREDEQAISEPQLSRTMFHVKIKTTIPAAILNQEGDKAAKLVTWYQNLTNTKTGIEVIYGEANNPEGSRRVFGSRFDDDLRIDGDVMFAYGGEGEDIYRIEPSETKEILYLYNVASDQKKDYIDYPVPFNTITTGVYHNNSIVLESAQVGFSRKLVLSDYCNSDSSQSSLKVVTEDSRLFEPPDCQLVERHPECNLIVKNFRLGGLKSNTYCKSGTNKGSHKQAPVHTREKREITDAVNKASSFFSTLKPKKKQAIQAFSNLKGEILFTMSHC